MKRKFILCAALILCILVGVSIFIPVTSYKRATANFDHISVTEVNKKIDENMSFFIYLGRETCPACCEMVPKLASEVGKIKLTMFYLDTEKSKNNIKIDEFRRKYHIKFVPTVLYFDENSTCYALVDWDSNEQIRNWLLNPQEGKHIIPLNAE